MVKDQKLYDVPVIVAGDFNIDLNFSLVLSDKLKKFTTGNQTSIDGVFTRRLDKLTTRRFVSYFSHHSPFISVQVAGRDASNNTVNVKEIANLKK